jgi:hypothetical protein
MSSWGPLERLQGPVKFANFFLKLINASRKVPELLAMNQL